MCQYRPRNGPALACFPEPKRRAALIVAAISGFRLSKTYQQTFLPALANRENNLTGG